MGIEEERKGDRDNGLPVADPDYSVMRGWMLGRTHLQE